MFWIFVTTAKFYVRLKGQRMHNSAPLSVVTPERLWVAGDRVALLLRDLSKRDCGVAVEAESCGGKILTKCSQCFFQDVCPLMSVINNLYIGRAQ